MARHPKWGYDTGVNDLLPGDRSTTIDQVTAHFGDVTAAAEAFIRGSDQVVGAVAWVRSPRLLAVLRERPTSLIVNKEFPLRRPGSKERDALDQLGKPARGFGATARVLGDCSRGAFTGLMHHKFLVRLTHGIPSAVWTGSFNFTSGAAGNFENAVEITDPGVASIFYDEFRRLWDISEPLNFRQGAPRGSAGVQPRRAGTNTAPKAKPVAAQPRKKPARTARKAA